MRGKVCEHVVTSYSRRITPAYAGKRYRRCYNFPALQDHPRLCGEKFLRRNRSKMDSGSPPPMRGKVHAFACFFPLCRITPAYAGKSAAMSGRYQVVTDHPRLCGEKTQTSQPDTFGQGSPPPMRGKDARYNLFTMLYRITPAYAGKSPWGRWFLV